MDRSKKAALFKRPSAKQLGNNGEDDLDGWFEEKKRGRGAKIILCNRPDGVWFALVRHGGPFKREESLEEGSILRASVIVRSNTTSLCTRPEIGELRINALFKGEKQLYCEEIQQALLQAARPIPPALKSTPSPLSGN